jgi:protein-S-isoprenylcysteine O-methyltransferase Ste14
VSNDEPDKPGIRVPPPPIYLLALLLGLLLDRRMHVPFLPRGVARLIGLPLVGGGIVLAAWFARTMRSADTTKYINKPVYPELSRTVRFASVATPATCL